MKGHFMLATTAFWFATGLLNVVAVLGGVAALTYIIQAWKR